MKSSGVVYAVGQCDVEGGGLPKTLLALLCRETVVCQAQRVRR